MRPFDAGRSFDLGTGADRCFGGVLSAFRSARWKRSAMPGSSWISIAFGSGFEDRVIAVCGGSGFLDSGIS
jgi:hypothetical protein